MEVFLGEVEYGPRFGWHQQRRMSRGWRFDFERSLDWKNVLVLGGVKSIVRASAGKAV